MINASDLTAQKITRAGDFLGGGVIFLQIIVIFDRLDFPIIENYKI